MFWPFKFDLQMKKTGNAFSMRFAVHFFML